MLPMLKEAGVSTIELCGAHAVFKDATTHQAAIDACKKHGVSILSIGVEGLSRDAGELKVVFDFLKAGGVKHMSVDFQPENLDAYLKQAEKFAEEYGVTLGIHNHGGTHWLGNVQTLRWFFKKCSKRIGLSLDTGWALDAGENVAKILEEFKDRMYLIHLKDFTFDKYKRKEDVVTGTGILDLKLLRKTLDSTGFRGPYIIEFEGEPENPVPSLKNCVKNIKEALY